MSVYAVLAGGGTAGHAVPALAIARALVRRGHAAEEVHLVGSRRASIDARLFGDSEFPATYLPGRGIARRLTFQNVASVVGLAFGLVQAVLLLARLRPRVVVSMGGYAAAPCALAAAMLRVPLVLAEQNAVPTATHRLVARFASASAVPFDGTPLPRAVVTGNPVRDDVITVDASPAGRRAARAELGLDDDAFVVLAVGGSLGARTINLAVRDLAASWSGRSDVAIRHVVGERDWAELGGEPGGSVGAGIVYQRVRFEDRMPLALAAADLVVSRSGGSVAELAVVGRPAILVPLPIAPYNHQAENAKVFVRAGAAVLLEDAEVTAARLGEEIDRLRAVDGALERMAEAARSLGRPDAAQRVADLVEREAKAGERR